VKRRNPVKSSTELEILVSKIQRQLAPDAEVVHNARLPGKTGSPRQIDVLVRQKIGNYEMRIVLDCKDYARPVDVKAVEAFHGLLDDVGANKGAMVCLRGFTALAKERARGWQIDLYSPVDTDPHKWQVRVRFPTLCDIRRAGLGFVISWTAPKPIKIAEEFWKDTVALSYEMVPLGTPLDVAMDKWNRGVFTTEPGHHPGQLIFDEPVQIDNGYNDVVPVELTVDLYIERQLFFGQMPIQKISGFKDELSGAIITNAFTTGILNPEEVLASWLRIDAEKDLPVKPVFRFIGLSLWD
jgi:Restriction endonuclease